MVEKQDKDRKKKICIYIQRYKNKPSISITTHCNLDNASRLHGKQHGC